MIWLPNPTTLYWIFDIHTVDKKHDANYYDQQPLHQLMIAFYWKDEGGRFWFCRLTYDGEWWGVGSRAYGPFHADTPLLLFFSLSWISGCCKEDFETYYLHFLAWTPNSIHIDEMENSFKNNHWCMSLQWWNILSFAHVRFDGHCFLVKISCHSTPILGFRWQKSSSELSDISTWRDSRKMLTESVE
jgi:hypothetical protein